ncbi:MAG: HEAT repeat domain-containing protein [Anaerolineae bacterium]|nr:HEAT repeat domain-containing protein [Anaerolineae bacterium]
MRFDITSFLIGAAVAAVIGFIIYRLRDRLGNIRMSAQERVSTTRQYITTGAESRYLRDLTQVLNRQHMAGDILPLSKVYVEPQFLRPIEPFDPLSEDPNTEVYDIIPIFHDMPASYAPYNLETLSINDLRGGERHLALLGMPGIGKSTALAIIGLMVTGEIAPTTIDLLEDKLFEEEIKDLPPAERTKQIERRQQLQARALEQLKQEREREKEKNKDAQQVREVSELRYLLPILVHLRDVDLRPESYGSDGKSSKTLDPAEPLVKAMQGQFGTVTASSIPGMVYKRLVAGTCLVMIDGFDEMPAEVHPEKLAWLKEFIELYPRNMIIVSGSDTGYAGLLQLGLTPLFLRAWSDGDSAVMVDKWRTLWQSVDKDNKPIEDRTVDRVLNGMRGRSALDVTLKTWAAFSGDEQEAGRRGWYDFFVRQKMHLNLNRDLLNGTAAASLEKGGVPLGRDVLAQVSAAISSGTGSRTTMGGDAQINRLTTRNGLMVEWSDSGKYGFVHPLITAFLASETLANADAATVAEFAEKPAWNMALAFASAHAPVEAAVLRRLSQPADLMYSGLFSLAHWLTDGPGTAPWKADVFKRLTAALLAPTQFPMVRERAMAALVTSHDSGVLFIFRQALRQIDPLVRRLGCLGLGAHGDPESIRDLENMLEDQNPDVKLAAGLGLGVMGTDAALEKMVRSFVEGEQSLRRAIAEALAAMPGEGHAVLREAISANDMMLRHAAVYGLARVKAAWSVALLYRTLLEDEQWYVRNAANEAFTAADSPEKSSILKFPEADKLPWLVAWAAKRGDSVPQGDKARQVLIRTLQEGEAPVKAAAALTLAQLGHVPALKPLYSALTDRDEHVRAAAHTALGLLQTRFGEPFPAVN